MPRLTEAQLAKIRAKEAATPDALKRDALTNYREGVFFVTLNTRDYAPILSMVKGSIGAQGPNAPHCEYTALGQKVKEVWERTPNYYPEVEVIACEVMPEHFHGLLRLMPGNRRHLGQIIGGFMAGCSHAYWDSLGIDWKNMKFDDDARASLNSKQRGRGYIEPDRDRDHTRSFRGPALFVRGYNDTEPITPEQVQIKLEYIAKQAERRLLKGNHYECFCIHRNKHSKNWTPAAIARAISADRFFGHNEQKCREAQAKIMARIATQPLKEQSAIALPLDEQAATAQPLTLSLDFIGNRSIMAAPQKLPLICHRADATRFEEQKAAVIDAVRQGAVIVSAFISPKEKEIKEQLMSELLPLIEIMDNGFSDRYKPTGRAFYACAEMRMVQISPWRYEYQKQATVSREMCLVMNELARVITGEADDWWKRRPPFHPAIAQQSE
ncbi:MAG: hypothetical protein Q4D33_05605 [Prevotellaceae bacterium]|nr:hypothetical protein [Prevotellaceae bacterium]